MIKNFKYNLALLLLIQITSLFGINTTKNDLFYRYLIENETVGYVLFGDKPIATVYAVSPLRIDSDGFESDVLILKGIREIKARSLADKVDKDYIFHIDETYKRLQGEKTLSVINKSMFQKVFEDNKYIFKTILGSNVTFDKLFDEFLFRKKSLYLAINNNEILVGILLGFGTNNSIVHHHMYELEENQFTSETLPYKPNRKDFEEDGNEILVRILNPHLIPTQRNIKKTSFGFDDINQEIEFYHNINAEADKSLDELYQNKPNLIFGVFNKELQENKNLIAGYKKTQKDLQALLEKDNISKEVLIKIAGETKANETYTAETIDLSNKEIIDLIAKQLAFINKDETEAYSHAFLEGMTKSDNQEPKDEIGEHDVHQVTKFIVEAKEKMDVEEDIFLRYSVNDEYTSIVDGKLYYKIFEKGTGEILKKENNKVRAKLMIATLDGTNMHDILMKQDVYDLDLTKLITGLAHGMLGMKIGEEREIIIHPEYAYGIYANIDPALIIIVNVILVDINIEPIKGEFPKLENVDLAYEPTIKAATKEKYLKEEKVWGLVKGYEFWQYYQTLKPRISLQEVMDRYHEIRRSFDLKQIDDEYLKSLEDLHIMVYDLKMSKT